MNDRIMSISREKKTVKIRGWEKVKISDGENEKLLRV